MYLRVILSITYCLHDSSLNQTEIYEQLFNSGIKQSKLPRVSHFRKDWSPPRRLLVGFNLLKSEIRQVDALLDSFTKNVLCHNKIFNYKFTDSYIKVSQVVELSSTRVNEDSEFKLC